MRLPDRPRIFALLAAPVFVLLGAAACNDSNTVSGPAAESPSADFSGTWTGEFLAEGTSCDRTEATAVLQQTGNRVSGSVRTASCGLNGSFVGTVQGDYLMGSIEMLGCTGGATSGRIGTGGQLTLSVDELKKELVSEDAIVMPGGQLRLQR